MKKRILTVYEAQHLGKADFEVYHKEIDELKKQINAKNTAIEAMVKKQQYKYWLKIKATSFDVSENYLQIFLEAVKPITDVVQAEWGRYK